MARHWTAFDNIMVLQGKLSEKVTLLEVELKELNKEVERLRINMMELKKEVKNKE